MSFPWRQFPIGFQGLEKVWFRVSRFDRYLLSQFLALFGFFSLVLVAVYWVNRAVGLFDHLIGDGQSALVFLEFSLLLVPNVIRLVLPIAAFAATVYGVNRLMQDSELVVMQATGFSAFRLARPVFFFGACVFVMQMILMNYLVPLSQIRLQERTNEVQENVTSRFLTAGRFVHPSDGITLYIREITPLGELNDLFLSDERSETEQVSYTARKAIIIPTDGTPQLLMIDGMAQRLTRDGTQRMALTRFADFTLDMAEIAGPAGKTSKSLRELPTLELLIASEATLEKTRAKRAALLEEGHGRLAGPLLGIAAPLLGFAALMLGGFSRFGAWRQIGVAVLMIIGLQMLNTAGSSAALKSPSAWPAVYAAPLFGILFAMALLWYSQRPKRLKPPPALSDFDPPPPGTLSAGTPSPGNAA